MIYSTNKQEIETNDRSTAASLSFIFIFLGSTIHRKKVFWNQTRIVEVDGLHGDHQHGPKL